MLEVKGFRGVRFDAKVVGNMDSAVTPPYDVITAEERRELVSRNPYTMAKLILPEDEGALDRYAVAARDFSSWLKAGALRQDEDECIYLLSQRFREQHGWRVRSGFLAVAKLPEQGENTVLAHERTFSHVVDDRYRLTESTRANLGPVFVLYDDGMRTPDFLAHEPESEPDIFARTIDGVEQRIWKIPTPEGLTDYFRDKRLYIADGHHRFHTARVYRDNLHAAGAGPGEHDYVLMGFVSLNNPGLVIYPTHRLMNIPEGFNADAFLESLAPWFEIESVDKNMTERVEREEVCAIGLVVHGRGQYLLRLRPIDRRELLGDERTAAWRDLDVAVLHKGIVEKIMGLGDYTGFDYERDAGKAISAVESGGYTLGFIHRSPTAGQIRACAEAGENMPHKSTYFFPKLPTGAAIHLLY